MMQFTLSKQARRKRPRRALASDPDSSDEGDRLLSGLQSRPRQGPRKAAAAMKSGTQKIRSAPRRSPRKLRAANDRNAPPAPASSDSDEVQEIATPARRHSSRRQTRAATAEVASDLDYQPPSARLSQRTRGATAHGARGLAREEQPQTRQLRSRGARARRAASEGFPTPSSEEESPGPEAPPLRITRASKPGRKALKPSHDSTPARFSENESMPKPPPGRSTRASRSVEKATKAVHESTPAQISEEESEPEQSRLRSARKPQPARKASKLVQGGGVMSGDDESASGADLLPETYIQMHNAKGQCSGPSINSACAVM